MSLQEPIRYKMTRDIEDILNFENHAFHYTFQYLFLKRDHEILIEKLKNFKLSLQWTLDALDRERSLKKNQENYYQLALCLMGFTDSIILVCTGLDSKSKGISYSNERYKSDLSLIAVKKNKCEEASRLCDLSKNWSELTKFRLF